MVVTSIMSDTAKKAYAEAAAEDLSKIAELIKQGRGDKEIVCELSHSRIGIARAFDGIADDISKFIARKQELQAQGLPTDEIIAILSRELNAEE